MERARSFVRLGEKAIDKVAWARVRELMIKEGLVREPITGMVIVNLIRRVRVADASSLMNANAQVGSDVGSWI